MPLIPDVHEHYLREAELLFESWDAALDSPAFVLDELLEGPEQRLVVQIDGLITGGSAIVDSLLLPVLDDEPDDDQHRTGAACLTRCSSTTSSPASPERCSVSSRDCQFHQVQNATISASIEDRDFDD